MRVTGVRCTSCKQVIWSTFRHDYHHCGCGATSVDGGRDYLRYGWDPEVGPPVQVDLDVSDRPYVARLALAGTANEIYRTGWLSKSTARQYDKLLTTLREIEQWTNQHWEES